MYQYTDQLPPLGERGELAALVQREKLQHLAAWPLRSQGETLGVVMVLLRRKMELTDLEQPALIVNHAAEALASARAVEELEGGPSLDLRKYVDPDGEPHCAMVCAG